MVKVLSSHVRGPLEPHVTGFAEGLLRQGYTRSSAGQQVCFIAHLDRWMQAADVGLGELDGPAIGRYLAERRTAGYVEYRSEKALRPLLDYLAPLGVLPGPVPAPPDVVDQLLDDYRDFLLRERGLTAGTAVPRLRGLRATVRGEPATRRRPGHGRDHRSRRHRVCAGRLPRPRCRLGETDRLRAAVAAEVAAPDRGDPAIAGGGRPAGGRLATSGAAEGSGTGPAAPAAGRL